MTAITKDQFDAATARLATDQADLKTELAALSEAQAAVTPAQAAADAAAQTLASAMQLVKVRQSAVDSTNADMKVQQAIIDAFNAQPPVVTPPPPIVLPPSGSYIMPDVPAFPQGPFTKHATIKVTATNNKINLPNPVEFGGSYICIDHTDPSVVLQQLLIAQALVDAQGGSLFYSGSGCGGLGATLGIVGCKKTRTGRPFLRFCGKWPGLISIDDLTAIYDTLPNTKEGDIATGAQG
jgi:hypothetical protein